MSITISRRAVLMGSAALAAGAYLQKPALAQSGEPIRWFIALAQAGLYASPAVASKEGAELALEDINAAGGILGRKVNLAIRDTAGDPTKAVSILQEEIAGGKPDFLVADMASAVALALFPIATRNEIVTLSMASSTKLDDPKAYPYGFSNTTRFEKHFDLIREQMKAAGAKRAAGVLPLDAYGDNHVNLLTNALKDTGIELQIVRFDPKSVDISPAFQQALDFKPDVIYADHLGSGVPGLLDGRLKAGAAKVPTIGGQGVGHMDITKLVGPDALQNLTVLYYRTDVVDPTRPNPRADKIIERLKAKGSKLDQPAGVYLMAYDWLQYYKAAAEQADSTEGSKVRDALENLKVSGESPWLMWKNGIYTSETHFPTVTQDDFLIAKPGPVVDGRFQVSF